MSQYTVIFEDKKTMQQFENDHAVPKDYVLDYFDDSGKPSTANTESYLSNYCDFIIDGEPTKAITVFLSMEEEWRKMYWAEDQDGNMKGGFILQPHDSTVAETIDRIENRDKNGIRGYERFMEWRNKQVWLPPATWPVNINDILNHKAAQPPPLIDGLLQRGESLLISGAAGVGKSLLVNYIAYALAIQKNIWDQFTIPTPLTSLIIQAEVDGHAFKARVKKLTIANPEFRTDRVHILGETDDFLACNTSGWLDDPEFQQRIVEACKECKADVIFIDPLISYNRADENDNTQMRKALDSFMKGIEEANVGVIIIHHTKKDGKGTRGASAIRDWTANALELSLDRLENSEARIKVTHDKARNFKQKDPFYIIRTKDLSFELAESKASQKEDERLKCVVDALTEAGGRVEGQKQFAELIGQRKNSVKPRTAIDRIKDARDCGLILEFDQGHRKPKLYQFPELNKA